MNVPTLDNAGSMSCSYNLVDTMRNIVNNHMNRRQGQLQVLEGQQLPVGREQMGRSY